MTNNIFHTDQYSTVLLFELVEVSLFVFNLISESAQLLMMYFSVVFHLFLQRSLQKQKYILKNIDVVLFLVSKPHNLQVYLKPEFQSFSC